MDGRVSFTDWFMALTGLVGVGLLARGILYAVEARRK
jgi:hypothetical protein